MFALQWEPEVGSSGGRISQQAFVKHDILDFVFTEKPRRCVNNHIMSAAATAVIGLKWWMWFMNEKRVYDLMA